MQLSIKLAQFLEGEVGRSMVISLAVLKSLFVLRLIDCDAVMRFINGKKREAQMMSLNP